MWGLNVVMVKYLVGFFSPLLLSTVRMTIAAIVLVPLVMLIQGNLKIPRGTLKYLLGLAFCSIYLHQITLGFGVQRTTASTASLIIGTIPLLTSMLSYVVYKEPISFRRIGGILVGFVGVLLVIWGSGNEQAWLVSMGSGEILVFLAALGYAISNLFVKKLSDVLSPLTITAWMHLLASPFLWLTVLLWMEPVHLSASPTVLGILLVSSIGPTALATVGFNIGIQRLGASNTALFLNGIPAASMLFAALYLGETIHLFHILGFIGIVTGIIFGSADPQQRNSSQAKGSNGKKDRQYYTNHIVNK